jgi:hypothetical protein
VLDAASFGNIAAIIEVWFLYGSADFAIYRITGGVLAVTWVAETQSYRLNCAADDHPVALDLLRLLADREPAQRHGDRRGWLAGRSRRVTAALAAARSVLSGRRFIHGRPDPKHAQAEQAPAWRAQRQRRARSP